MKQNRSMMTVGDLIRTIMLAVGENQSKLADKTGRPHSAINQMINGRKHITPESAEQIGRVLGIRAHVLLLMQSFDELDDK